MVFHKIQKVTRFRKQNVSVFTQKGRAVSNYLISLYLAVLSLWCRFPRFAFIATYSVRNKFAHLTPIREKWRSQVYGLAQILTRARFHRCLTGLVIAGFVRDSVFTTQLECL